MTKGSSKGGAAKIALISLAGLMVIGVGGWTWWSHREERRAITHAWDALSQCLLGEPLRAGEKPSARYHTIDLMAPTLPKGRAELELGRDTWPARCATNAQIMKRALEAAGRSDGDDKVLSDRLEGISGVAAYTPQALDELWAAATKVGLLASPTTDEPPPPPAPPHAPLTADTFDKAEPILQGGDLASLEVSREIGTAVHILFQKNRLDPWLCSIDEKNAKCGALPPSIAPGLSYGLAGATDDAEAPLIVTTGEKGDTVLRSDTGDVVARGFNDGALTTTGGLAVVLTSEGERRARHKFTIHRQSRGASTDSMSWTPPKDYDDAYSPILYAGRLFYVGGRGSSDTTTLIARAIPAEGSLGPPEEVGPSRVSPRQGCRAGGSTFIYTDKFVSISKGSTWSKPLGVAFADGWVACTPDASTLVRFHDDGLQLQRCEVSGCAEVSSIPFKHLSRAEIGDRRVAAMVGDKLFVSWPDARGVELFRFATAQAMKDAPTEVLFDPFIQEGKLEDTGIKHKVMLVPRANFVLALFQLKEKVYAARIFADGSFAPVTLAAR